MNQKKKHFTQEQVNEAASKNILEVAQSLGIKIHQVGSSTYAFRDVDNSALVFSDTLNEFYNHKTNESGNAITLSMIYGNMTFPDAVANLLDGSQIFTTVESTYEQRQKEPFRNYFKKSFDKNCQSIKNFLIDERGLDHRIVKKLIENEYIIEDGYKQAVFFWSQNNLKVGATVQGTKQDFEKYPQRGYFKGIAKNSESDYGFNVTLGDNPTRMYVFESPIDALSYWSLNVGLDNAVLFSMDGLKPKSVFKMLNQLDTFKQNSDEFRVYLGVDNDEAGTHFKEEMLNFPIERQQEPQYATNRLFNQLELESQFKDWNEKLQYYREHNLSALATEAYYLSEDGQKALSVTYDGDGNYTGVMEDKDNLPNPLIINVSSKKELMKMLDDYDLQRIAKQDLKEFGFDGKGKEQIQELAHEDESMDYDLEF